MCISMVSTFILINRFTREESQETYPIPPPIPEVPERTVQSTFHYPPEIFRDPFKPHLRIGLSAGKIEQKASKEEIKSEAPLEERVKSIAKPGAKAIQSEETRKITKVEEIRTKEEVSLPRVKVTGIIYDEDPIAILEFEGKSGIFGKGDKLHGGLLIKDIYLDSIDIVWKDKVYNIKLGGN